LPDQDDERLRLRAADAIALLGHPLFTATGPDIGQPRWVASGHHPGSLVGNLKLIFNASDEASVSVTTGNEIIWGRDSSEFAVTRPVELMIDDSLQRFDAGVTEDGEIVIQTFVDGRRLEVELRGMEPDQVRIVRIAEVG
jgi:hypothetical protein